MTAATVAWVNHEIDRLTGRETKDHPVLLSAGAPIASELGRAPAILGTTHAGQSSRTGQLLVRPFEFTGSWTDGRGTRRSSVWKVYELLTVKKNVVDDAEGIVEGNAWRRQLASQLRGLFNDPNQACAQVQRAMTNGQRFVGADPQVARLRGGMTVECFGATWAVLSQDPVHEHPYGFFLAAPLLDDAHHFPRNIIRVGSSRVAWEFVQRIQLVTPPGARSPLRVDPTAPSVAPTNLVALRSTVSAFLAGELRLDAQTTQYLRASCRLQQLRQPPLAGGTSEVTTYYRVTLKKPPTGRALSRGDAIGGTDTQPLCELTTLGLHLYVERTQSHLSLVIEAEDDDAIQGFEHAFVSLPDGTLVEETRDMPPTGIAKMTFGGIESNTAELQRQVGISSRDCAFVAHVTVALVDEKVRY